MVEKKNISVVTLQELANAQKDNISIDEVLCFEVNEPEICLLKLNYPSKQTFISLVLMIEGILKVSVDSQIFVMNPRDILFINPSNVIEFLDYDQCVFRSILISVDFFSSLNMQFDSQNALNLLSNNYAKVLSLDHDVYDRICNCSKSIEVFNHPQTPSLFFKEKIKNSLLLIFYELANYNYSQTDKKFRSSRKEEITIKFAALVGQYYREKKDVQFYADKLAVTRTHLTRTVGEVFHKSPKQIIEDKIIAEIKILLAKNTLSIGQVMQELHFEDQSAFSKFFQKNTGYTPSAYKKTLFQTSDDKNV